MFRLFQSIFEEKINTVNHPDGPEPSFVWGLDQISLQL